MFQIGRFNRLKIYKIVSFGVYLTDGVQEVLLPAKCLHRPAKEGDRLDVFLYCDSEDRVIATTEHPRAMAGEVAVLPVVATTKIGAFLDWGLEKDLFWPFGEQNGNVVAGKSYAVKILFDQVSGRIIASNRFNKLATGNAEDFQLGAEVSILVVEEHPIGYKALVNDNYLGMIYRNEVFRQLRIGDRLPGYVKKIREDNKLDLALRPIGYAGVLTEKEKIMQLLHATGGFLPYNAESTPEELQRAFQMSKKTFKKAIGSLYKERLIQIDDEGIREVSSNI